MIGLGITTYNRPEYLKSTLQSVVTHLSPLVDEIIVVDDHSDRELPRMPEGVTLFINAVNSGVAHSKNRIFKYFLDKRADYIFTLEDDVYPTSSKAVTGYIEAHKATGIHHMNFAHHGPANASGYLDRNHYIELYPHVVGAYSFYTRHALETVGLMDETLRNAWEHVFHTKQMADAHLTTPFWFFADARGSNEWLKEHENAIKQSSIRRSDEWLKTVEKNLIYASEKYGALPVKPYTL